MLTGNSVGVISIPKIYLSITFGDTKTSKTS